MSNDTSLKAYHDFLSCCSVGYTFVGDHIQQMLPRAVDPNVPVLHHSPSIANTTVIRSHSNTTEVYDPKQRDSVPLAQADLSLPSSYTAHSSPATMTSKGTSVDYNEKFFDPSPDPFHSPSSRPHSSLFDIDLPSASNSTSPDDRDRDAQKFPSSSDTGLFVEHSNLHDQEEREGSNVTILYDFSSHPDNGRKKAKRNAGGGIVVSVETNEVVDDAAAAEAGLHAAVGSPS
jgi:hypothetical protein